MSKHFRNRFEEVTSKEKRIKDFKRDRTNHHEQIRQARKLKMFERNQVFGMNILNEKPLAGE